MTPANAAGATTRAPITAARARRVAFDRRKGGKARGILEVVSDPRVCGWGRRRPPDKDAAGDAWQSPREPARTPYGGMPTAAERRTGGLRQPLVGGQGAMPPGSRRSVSGR